jgi:hypothetical protein
MHCESRYIISLLIDFFSKNIGIDLEILFEYGTIVHCNEDLWGDLEIKWREMTDRKELKASEGND